jgi:hypothetical protein
MLILLDQDGVLALPAQPIEARTMDSTERRDHAETLRRLGFLADAEYMRPWAEKIGQFIFNFGGIELVTHKYLLLLEKSEPEFDESLNRLLQPRIDRILELLDRATHLPQPARQLAIRDWGEIKKMCLWRNHIAHNPVLPYWGWDKNPQTDPPEGITMPDLRQLKSGGGVEVSLAILSELVEVSANLSRRLVETANSLPQARQR